MAIRFARLRSRFRPHAVMTSSYAAIWARRLSFSALVARSVKSISFWSWMRFSASSPRISSARLLQAGLILLKRDPDNQIATDKLAAEVGLAIV